MCGFIIEKCCMFIIEHCIDLLLAMKRCVIHGHLQKCGFVPVGVIPCEKCRLTLPVRPVGELLLISGFEMS